MLQSGLDLGMRGSVLGHPVLRTEDPGMLTGATRYLDDVVVDDALSAVFVRSITAHALLGEIEVAGALKQPGVVGVFTAQDLDLPGLTSTWVDEVFARPPLAKGTVRFAGEAVAVVIRRDSGACDGCGRS